MVRLLTKLAAVALAVASSLGPIAVSGARAADAAKGRSVFASQCSICHSNSRNGPVVVGPPLFGVVGRRAGTVASFNYSGAMKAAGFVWTPDRLKSYLPGPTAYLPGVKMTYPGLKNPDQLEDLIAYLETLQSPQQPQPQLVKIKSAEKS